MLISPRTSRQLATIVAAAAVGVLPQIVLGQSCNDGPAGGPPSPARPAAPLVPAGLNDMLEPAVPLEWVPVERLAPAPDAGNAPIPSKRSLAERLSGWDEATRGNAQLQLELPAAVQGLLGDVVQRIEAAWDAGAYDLALGELEWVESTGVPVALGVSWRTPQSPGAGRDFTDVRIGARTGGASTVLDYDAATRALFAVVRWDTDGGWALYRSTNAGGTWSETYFWFAGTGAYAQCVDMVVVANYVYVGYVQSTVANEARLRRCFVSTGGSDTGYLYQVILNAAPSTITEVSLASNNDSFANRIYYAVRQSNNALRWAWDIAADGTTFEEDSPAGIAARGGLDSACNPGFASYFLYLSYVGTDNRIHVLRKRELDWTEATSTPFDGSHLRTAISAWDERVICAHELQMTNGQGIRYFISYDAGETWSFPNYLAVPAPGEGGYQMADVTARGGAGTAVVFTHETGEPDDVLIRYRRDYAPGPWQPALRVNDRDVTTGSWTALNWTPRSTPHPNELSYGLIYFDGSTPYYNRLQRLSGDLNCDGAVNFDDIDAFVLALSGAGLYGAAYPNCDIRNGDCNNNGVVNFDDIDPFVAVLSGG